MAPEADHARALGILIHRCGLPTIVRLVSGKACTVHDVAWGYDMGEEIAHITTNISPGPAERRWMGPKMATSS